jgi:hypothetical protein
MLATMYLLPAGVDQEMLLALGYDSENFSLDNGEIEKFQASNEFGVSSEHYRLQSTCVSWRQAMQPPVMDASHVERPRSHQELSAYVRSAPFPVPPAVVNKVCWELGLRLERLVSLLNTDSK